MALRFTRFFGRIPGPRPSGSTGRILYLIGASGIATLALIVLAALWAGAESDLAALDRQKQLVTARLSEQVDQVVKDIRQIAVGYVSLLSPAHPRDGASPATRSANQGAAPVMTADAATAIALTRTAISVFGYDDAFVLDGDGTLVVRSDAEMERRFLWMKPLLKSLLNEIARSDDASRQAAGRAEGQDPPGGRALAYLMRLQGRPTIVGIVGVRDDEKPAAEATRLAHLIVIRFLDGSALDELSREQGLTGARFARAADPEGPEVAFQIDATATGDPIGFIIWSPDLPGSRVVGRLVPALSLAGLVLATLFSFLLLRLRKSLKALETSEHQSRHLAHHDVLTGLPNRALFAGRLEACVAACDAGRRSALVLIDLDRFKIVNDTHGHAAGDDLIRQACERMRRRARPGDVLARLGGDEFALLVEDIGEGDEGVEHLIQAILSDLNEPFGLLHGKVTVRIGASFGIATLPDAGLVPDDLMRYADTALYEAKNTGRGCWIVFEPSMITGRNEREMLKADLRTVLEGGPNRGNAPCPADGAVPMTDCGVLDVHFQPIHRAAGHGLSGAEALVRWHHGRLGLLPPDRFIALAEESGLIDRLGLHVLEVACRAAAEWPADLYLAVNVSPVQFRSPHFVDAVLAVLSRTGLAPTRLELELTESGLFDDDRTLATAFARLRAEGIQIALDDFGTGFSSLSHLVQFSIDRIKIDRSFVSLLGTDANGAGLVAAIVGLARSFGMATTAEGVETEAQRTLLAALGCRDLQGYGFARPMTRVDFDRYRTRTTYLGDRNGAAEETAAA